MCTLHPVVDPRPSYATVDLSTVVNYFAQDPLKILYMLGGAGGIHYWINQWRDRRRISVRWIKEIYGTAHRANCNVTLLVEITNLGSAPTSLGPRVTVVGLTPERKRQCCALEVTEDTRVLPPHEPRMFHATGSCEAEFLFLWYKTYVFPLSRGRIARVRVRNVKGRILRLPQFVLERFLFRLGRVREDP